MQRSFQTLCWLSRIPLALGLVFTASSMVVGQQALSSRDRIVKLVSQIQRADYEADRVSLERLYQELGPLAADREFGTIVLYWRGFAQWRRAFNGFNDGASPEELRDSLRRALASFEEALQRDPANADARVAAGSSLGLLLFLHAKKPDLDPAFNDPVAINESRRKALAYMDQAEASAPENPRVLWVVGQVRWILPPEKGGGQDLALAKYEKGLRAARAARNRVVDPLVPSWGEPELLMNLAYSNMHRRTPDLDAAEKYAREALSLVPYWHYVKDILLPQILKARNKGATVGQSLVDQMVARLQTTCPRLASNSALKRRLPIRRAHPAHRSCCRSASSSHWAICSSFAACNAHPCAVAFQR